MQTDKKKPKKTMMNGEERGGRGGKKRTGLLDQEQTFPEVPLKKSTR